jgi:hypothetical protein
VQDLSFGGIHDIDDEGVTAFDLNQLIYLLPRYMRLA